MPIDSTFVLACEASALCELFEDVEQELLSLGFSRGREVLVSNHEDKPESEEEETVVVRDLTENKTLLHGWRSIYMEFHSSEFSLSVQFDRRARGLTEGYIFIRKNTLHRLHKDHVPVQFYDTIAGIAALSKAVGGFAGFEAELMDAPPEQTLLQLLANPGDRGSWFDIHVVDVSRLTNTNVESAWATDFARIERRGFVFFIRREFLEMCHRFG